MEAEQIADFVRDHWQQFGCYPMEVETDNAVYTFDQYWSILDAANIVIEKQDTQRIRQDALFRYAFFR